jgi:hypothetical protein
VDTGISVCRAKSIGSDPGDGLEFKVLGKNQKAFVLRQRHHQNRLRGIRMSKHNTRDRSDSGGYQHYISTPNLILHRTLNPNLNPAPNPNSYSR